MLEFSRLELIYNKKKQKIMSIALHSMLLALNVFALVVAAIQGNIVNCAIATSFCLLFGLQIVFYSIALREINREYAMEVDRLLKEVDEVSKKIMEDFKNYVLNSTENQKNDNLSSSFNEKTLEKTKKNQKNDKNNQKNKQNKQKINKK